MSEGDCGASAGYYNRRMEKNRLEAFSHGVLAILWLVPDRRIERMLARHKRE